MNTLTKIKTLAIAALSVAMMTACAGGGAAMEMKDLPVYPGATELKPGESRIAETLQKNMEQDAQIRNAAGTGGKTEQKGFKFPADASWDKVKTFYTDKLKATGWSEGIGGPGGAIANNVLNQVNAQNSAFQNTIYSKGNQTLAVFRMADPTDKNSVVVIASLSTR